MTAAQTRTSGPSMEPAGVTLSAGHRAALEAEREFLLASLRDLESERAAGELDRDRYEALLAGYAARAARVLRALEAAGAPTASEPPPVDRRRRWRRRVLLLVPVLAVAAGALLVLPTALSRREPGQTVTGNEQSVDGTTASLERAVAETPEDPAAHRALARVLLDDEELVGALQHYDEAARLDPGDAESRAYAGWIVSLAGLPDDALERLDAAVAADPTYPDAHFFRGMVLLRGKGDATGAEAELRRYLELAPDTPMRDRVDRFLAELEDAGPAAGPATPGAGG